MKSRILIALLTLTLTATIASANGPGGGRGPGEGGGREGGHAIVAADGTLFVSSTANESTTITAIRTAGTIAWTATITGHADVELSDGNLIYKTSATAADGTVTSTLNAISTSTGAATWTRAITGRVGNLVPFNGGTYAFVANGTTRSIVAVGNDGAVLWTLTL